MKGLQRHDWVVAAVVAAGMVPLALWILFFG